MEGEGEAKVGIFLEGFISGNLSHRVGFSFSKY